MFRGIRFWIGCLIMTGLAAGCDSGVKEGPVEFKPTDTNQFESMKNQMLEGMKTKDYTKKPAAPKATDPAPKPADAAAKGTEAEPKSK